MQTSFLTRTGFIITLMAIFFTQVYGQGKENHIKNPDFEEGKEGWTWWGGQPDEKGYKGDGIYIHNEEASWSGVHQIIDIPPGAHHVSVSGYMRTNDVKSGSKDHEKARIAVEFIDEKEKLVGGYPPVVVQQEGTNDWQQHEREYTIPSGAASFKVQMALGNCTGEAWYDNIKVTIRDDEGKLLGVYEHRKSGPTDEGEWYPIPSNPKKTGTHYVDWSSLLDAPAGKHGFLTHQEDQLVFEDGTAIRFFGTNLMAADCFPQKKAADSLAKRLSQMGCNLVRFHHMDAPWSVPNIFGNTGNTKQLDKKHLDRLDYLIAQLKKKGIYVYMDLLVHRKFSEAEGIDEEPGELGAKEVGYFHQGIIDLQKEYIYQLLTHKNPYTDKEYRNDPVIIGSEFINESTLFTHFDGSTLTETHRRKLEEQFEEATGKKQLCHFGNDYESFRNTSLKIKGACDTAASIAFIRKKEQEYYDNMYSYMRSIGVKYPLSGSNFPQPILAYLADNLQNDVDLTNQYWDHPQVWKVDNDWERLNEAPVNNTSQLGQYKKNNVIDAARFQWANRPMMITEYNACFPNEYILENMPFMSAYASLQGWDGLMQFHFSHKQVGDTVLHPFDYANNPIHLAQWVVAAPLFLNEWIPEASNELSVHVPDKKINAVPSYESFLDEESWLPYVSKVSMKPTNEPKTELEEKQFKYAGYQYDEVNNDIYSDNNALKFSAGEKTLELKSDYVQGGVGAIKHRDFDFGFFKFDIKNPWASVLLASAGKGKLATAKKCYLVVVTPVKHTDQQYTADRKRLKEWGKLPLLAQRAEGTVTFKKNIKKIIACDPSGERTEVTDELLNENNKQLQLNKGSSFVYEIRFE